MIIQPNRNGVKLNAVLEEEMRKKKNLREWEEKLDARVPKFKPSRRAASTVLRVRLPGEKCVTHARRRLARQEIFKPLRAELMRAFIEFNGSELGMTACVNLKSGVSTWFEIVLVYLVQQRSTN